MADEFIVKNGLLVRNFKPDGFPLPSSSFNDNIFVPNIPDKSSQIPSFYLQIDSGSKPTIFEQDKFSKITGSEVAFTVAYSQSQYIVLGNSSGKTIYGAGGLNQLGYLNDGFGSSKTTLRIGNAYGYGGGTFDGGTNTAAFFGFTHTAVLSNPILDRSAKIFYRSKYGELQSADNDILIDFWNDVNCDGAIIEYTFKEKPGAGQEIRKTGRILSSWNQTTGVSSTDIACPTTIGITGPELYLQVEHTSGSPGTIDIKAYNDSSEDVSVFISCKLFRTGWIS